MGTRRTSLARLPSGFELQEGEDAPTDKQLTFAMEYARCGNRSEAARAAGYKKPEIRGWALVKNYPVVRRLVAHVALQIEKQANVDKAWLLTEMAMVAKANIMDFVDVAPATGLLSMDPRKWKRNDTKAIERLKIETTTTIRDGDEIIHQRVEIRMTPKVGIFTALAKHVDIGAFKEDVDRERGTEIAERLARAAERLADEYASHPQLEELESAIGFHHEDEPQTMQDDEGEGDDE